MYSSYTPTEHVNAVHHSLNLSKQINDAGVNLEKKINIFKFGFSCSFNECRLLNERQKATLETLMLN